MASSPATMALGVGGIGFGSLLLYAAVKNLPLLGDKGVFKTFFTTGKLASPASLSGGSGASGAAAAPTTPVGASPDSAASVAAASTGTTPTQPKVVGSPTSVLTNNSPGPYYWLPEGFGL